MSTQTITYRGAMPYEAPADLGRVRRSALIVGVLGLLGFGPAYMSHHDEAMRAWLVAFIAWAQVSLGCLALLMIHHMSRGAWGIVARRIFEAGAKSLVFLAVAFVPIALSLPTLYSWARPEAADDPILVHKALWLNPAGFWWRAAGYFALWLLLAWRLAALSRQQDMTGDKELFGRMQRVAGPGIVLLSVTATFAAIDWMMSLDPHWFSSLYGAGFLAGMALSGLSFAVVLVTWLARREPMSGIVNSRHLHDLGKLILAFTAFWGYLTVSQLIIIWSANLPEEITFYLSRVHGPWKTVSILVAVAHFVIPFVVLLSRDVKRRARTLLPVAVWMVIIRWVEVEWQISPMLAHGDASHFPPLWIDILAFLGIGGLFVFFVCHFLQQGPLLAYRDPYLPEYLEGDHG